MAEKQVLGLLRRKFKTCCCSALTIATLELKARHVRSAGPQARNAPTNVPA